METVNKDSLQLAHLWVRLQAIQEEINNKVLPLVHHLGVAKQDAEMTDALENCSTKIGEHLSTYKLVAEARR